MADKSFGVKELRITGTGTPTIESPGGGNLNLNAATATFSGTVATSLVRQENSGNPSFIHLGTGGRVGILQTSPGSALEVKGGIRSAQTPASGHIDLKHDGTNASLTTTSGHFLFYNENDSGEYIFHTTSSNSTKVKIQSTGRFLVGTTSPLESSSSSAVAMHLKGGGGGPYNIVLQNLDTGGGANQIKFFDGSGHDCGDIVSNATNNTTAYNTSSDYRLKENKNAISDGITRIKQLKPYRFNFISNPDKTKVDGFYAHEVSDVVPEAITGIKDEVDSEGNPKYQKIDHSKLVPLLTAALQEAITEIETLKTEVAALKGS